MPGVRQGVRDLVYLVLQSFTEPSTLDRFPVVAAGSSLQLSAIGSITTPKVEGGGNSPASSMTSEQQSLADVDESAKGGPSGSTTTAKKGGVLSGRKLSFTRTSKKK